MMVAGARARLCVCIKTRVSGHRNYCNVIMSETNGDVVNAVI